MTSSLWRPFNPNPRGLLVGNCTDTAVKNYQKANGLTADGVIGQNTWQCLLGIH